MQSLMALLELPSLWTMQPETRRPLMGISGLRVWAELIWLRLGQCGRVGGNGRSLLHLGFELAPDFGSGLGEDAVMDGEEREL
jgi:hypothetical protein